MFMRTENHDLAWCIWRAPCCSACKCLSRRTEKWGFMFYSHELQLEPQRNGLKSRGKDGASYRWKLLGLTILVAFGLVSMGTCFAAGWSVASWLRCMPPSLVKWELVSRLRDKTAPISRFRLKWMWSISSFTQDCGNQLTSKITHVFLPVAILVFVITRP